MRAKPSNNTSGYVGVDKRGSMYRARITSENGRKIIGKFNTAEEADAARLNSIQVKEHLNVTSRSTKTVGI
jgi:hypothetical protein